VVLTDTSLEHLVKPVCVDHVRIEVKLVAFLISCRSFHSAVRECHAYVIAVLLCIHHVIDSLLYLVNTHVATVVDSHRLILLTALCCDDNHTVRST